MEQRVIVMRNRKTGEFVLQPVGTFKGHGAFIGIAPYRELPPDASSERIGEMVLELLEKSGPKGRHIRELVAYQNETNDPETKRVIAKHLPPARASTKWVARNFQKGEVRRKSGQKSWLIVPQTYEADHDWFRDEQDVRITFAKGVKTLGEQLLVLIAAH